jgi:hypothetical protein
MHKNKQEPLNYQADSIEDELEKYILLMEEMV